MRRVWILATVENRGWEKHFHPAEFVYANEWIIEHEDEAKHGDIGVVMGIENLSAKQYDLTLQSREKAHDVLIIGWNWSGRFRDKARARHAGAPEHGDEPHAMPVQLAKR